jgi:hypothetical protein
MRLDISTSTTSPILSSAPISSFFLSIQINYNNFIISTHALLDSGVLANFIDKKFVNLHSIPLILKKTPVNVEVIDGRLIASGVVTHETIPLSIKIGDKLTIVSFNVIESSCFSPLILGLSWLTEFNPFINWKTMKLTWNSQSSNHSNLILQPQVNPELVPMPISKPSFKSTSKLIVNLEEIPVQSYKVDKYKQKYFQTPKYKRKLQGKNVPLFI